MSASPTLFKSAFLVRNRLIERRERWGLTWQGWIALMACLAATGIILFFNAYSFLAPTAPVESDIAVFEGWISVSGAKHAVELIRSNHFSRVIVGGGPIHDASDYYRDLKTYAEQGAQRLTRAGLDESLISIVSAPGNERDRTYTEAVAIKEWLKTQNFNAHKINVISEAVHARRTRLLFQKAFRSEAEIGIIALPPREFPAERWWRYSAGVKEMISEGAAYIYARFFFWP